MTKLAEKFAELAQQYGPNVVDAAKRAAQVNAYSTLTSSIIWFGVAAVLFTISYFRFSCKNVDENDQILVTDVGVFLTIIAAFVSMGGLWCWVDPWTWTAIYHPEVYIAHHILGI